MKYLYLLLFTITEHISFSQQVIFKHDFAPTESFIKQQERPFRDGICLNGLWNFYPVDHAERLTKKQIQNPEIPIDISWESTKLKVPSPWNVNRFAKGDGGDFVTFPSYPTNWEKVRAGWLMRKLPYRKEWRNKRLILHFDAVNGYTQVFFNKKKVGENFDLFLPFEIDITDLVKDNSENELMVWVADAKLLDQPGKYGRRIYVGGSFWGDMITGIWQDVNLLVKPAIQIKSTFVKPFLDRDDLEVAVILTNETSKKQKIKIKGSIRPWINLAKNNVLEAPEPKWKLGEEALAIPTAEVSLEPHSTKTIDLKVKVNGKLKTWTSETPNLYGLLMKLNDSKLTVDQSYTRFGWRQVTMLKNKVYLNGKSIQFKGDSWHFMGIPQMTRRYAWAWFTMLKQCNANTVRLHAQPYPSFYLDMADEMGIFVLDETGIWASDGGPKCDSEEYWKCCENHLKRLIDRDHNHPSVFGWSVCNENIPVVVNVQHAPDSLINRQLTEINKWVNMARKLDPSRTWVSGDGETDLPTNLPTVIGHYGDENSYKKWSSQGKVWGVGECGMGYYGTPLQTSSLNGERSYESQQGRMEALAIEASHLLSLQKKYEASYSSVFNIIWYGLKPLELGLTDTTKAPGAKDGIFFGPYKEGQPGIQPERIGPYSTTLNPGYDLSLPLFKPWPLFYAVKEAFSNNQTIIPSKKPIKEIIQAANHSNIAITTILLSSDKDSVLYKTLFNNGFEFVNNISEENKTNILLIIDGIYPKDDDQSINLEKKVLKKGGNVIVLGIKPESKNMINKYLPQPIDLTQRKAYSFVKEKFDPITEALYNSDFYFAETSQQPVMIYGLVGEFVNQGKVLLKACNTNWKKWNNNAEYLKTGAIIRSEREIKAEGNALVAFKTEKSNIYFLTLDPETLFKVAPRMISSLFYNLGVTIKKTNTQSAINLEGILEKSQVLGSFDASGKTYAKIANTDFLKDEKGSSSSLITTPGMAEDGVFDLKAMHLHGPNINSVAYLSFWIYSPRSLANLLVEPDMPKFDMFIGADDGYQVYLNNQLLSESLKEGSLIKKEQKIPALPLEKGWNHFLIKSIQFGGDWKIAVQFECNNKKFMQELKSQVAH